MNTASTTKMPCNGLSELWIIFFNWKYYEPGGFLVLPATLRSILTRASAQSQAAQMVPSTWHIEARHSFDSPSLRKRTGCFQVNYRMWWFLVCVVCRMFSMKWRVKKFLVRTFPPTNVLGINFTCFFFGILCLTAFMVRPYHAMVWGSIPLQDPEIDWQRPMWEKGMVSVVRPWLGRG